MAFELDSLNDEQKKFILEVWKTNRKKRVHLKGAAGTGKTFVALHCVLDHLTEETIEEDILPVLFVCPTLSLSFHFTRWLLARLSRSNETRDRLLKRSILLCAAATAITRKFK